MEGLQLKDIVEWSVPVILGTGLHYLAQISSKIASLGESIAAMAVRVEETDRRLTAVEDWQKDSK